MYSTWHFVFGWVLVNPNEVDGTKDFCPSACSPKIKLTRVHLVVDMKLIASPKKSMFIPDFSPSVRPA